MPALDNRPDRRHLRRFGLTIATGMTVIGAVSFWRDHTVAPTMMWTAAVLIGVPALVAPAVLARVERAWLMFGQPARVGQYTDHPDGAVLRRRDTGRCVRPVVPGPARSAVVGNARELLAPARYGSVRCRHLPAAVLAFIDEAEKRPNGYDDSRNFSVLPRFGARPGRRRRDRRRRAGRAIHAQEARRRLSGRRRSSTACGEGGIRRRATSTTSAFYDKPLLKFERLLETYLGFAPQGLRSFPDSDAGVAAGEAASCREQIRAGSAGLRQAGSSSPSTTSRTPPARSFRRRSRRPRS